MTDPSTANTAVSADMADSNPDVATEVFNSVKVSLADLCAKGAHQYAQKHWSEASDFYARASELQAELNGEMDPENAEILFLYGRSLFKVGQANSDVLGGRAGGEKKKSNGASKAKAAEKSAEAETDDKLAEEGVAGKKKATSAAKDEDIPAAKKPLFQFTGDENFEDSDDEDEDADEDDEEEETDDLADSFEVLDLARVLFTKRLEIPEDSKDKGKAVGDSAMTKHVKERLADCHDLLAEISLENERFPNAVHDFRASLAYKQELHPKESEIIAEAHFKLSLALEFASITTTKEDNEEDGAASEPAKEAQVDEAMREEAAKELELAIESTKLKLQNKEVELATCHEPVENDATRTQIQEVKEIIADMEQRLLDLRAPPVDVNAALNGPAGAADGAGNPLNGVLGATEGETPAETKARIEEAKKTATDLTGLVRRKKEKGETIAAAAEAMGAAPANTNGKRKAEDVDAGEESDTKKAKVEETTAEAKAEEKVEEKVEEA